MITVISAHLQLNWADQYSITDWFVEWMVIVLGDEQLLVYSFPI